MSLRRTFRLRSLRARLILAFLVTVLLPLVGTGLYGNWTTSRTLQAQALDAARADLRLRAEQMENYLGGVREDLLFLSQLKSLAVLLAVDDTTPDLWSDVQTDFVAFASSHPGVFQARYIDASGLEVLRVDATPDGIEVVTPERLQNKSDRYYFTQTMALSPGEVYISPLDLNREFGAVQVPHTPTIRYATPVFHPDGSRAGLVILNLYAEPFLRLARVEEGESDAFLALVDGTGYYLAHPDPAREWGSPSDLDTGAGAHLDYPQGWPEISQQLSGTFSPPENWFTRLLEVVLPPGFLPGGDRTTRHVLVYESVQPNGASGPNWLLLYDEPRSNLFASVWTFRLTAISILVIAALVALVMAVALARSLSAPILALTADVRRFGQGKSGRGPSASAALPNGARDEIEELTAAFKDMASAIDQHLEQLAALNRAGQHITARLDRPAVLDAAGYAIQRLFPVTYLSISMEDEIIHASGDRSWESYRYWDSVQAVLRAAAREANWRTVGLSTEEGLQHYLCCAPISVRGRLGLIELYGDDPALGEQAAGNLLSTLAVQFSIALENAELYARLAERQAELQAVVEQLIVVQEEERRVVAFDIHDGLIQMLVGARLRLRNFVAGREHDPSQADATLQKGLDELGAAITEARRVIEGLRPAALDDLGLVMTLQDYAAETLVDCPCELEFEARPPRMRVPPLVETTAFRIAQEAITNARKYADSPRLRVALALADDALTVEVRDWGHGFDSSTIPAVSPAILGNGGVRRRGVGLMSMRERARLLGGECTVESAPGLGTTVRATLPIPRNEEQTA